MIRSLRPEDASVVADLIRAAFAAIPIALDPPPSALRMTPGEVLAQEGGVVWDEDGVRGCLLWRARPDGLYVGRIAVAPGFRGRGVARSMLCAAEQEARRRGLVRLLLEVRLALTDNRRLFAAAGFQETAVRSHAGYAAPTFVEAEKWLGPR